MIRGLVYTVSGACALTVWGILVVLTMLLFGVKGCGEQELPVGDPVEELPSGWAAAPAAGYRIVEARVSFEDVFSPDDVPGLHVDWTEYRKGGAEGVHIVLYVQDRQRTRYANYPVRMRKDGHVHVWQTPLTYPYLGDTVYMSDDRGAVQLWAKLRTGDSGTISFDVGRDVLTLTIQ